MRHKPRWSILVGRKTWQVAKFKAAAVEYSGPELNDGEAPGATAEGIHTELVAQGYRGGPVLLALETECCVSMSLTIPSVRQGRNRLAMAYLLEPHLPWAAEDTIVDYELHGLDAFMVAIEQAPLVELITALESQGVMVQSICPASRLALEKYLREGGNKSPRHVLIWSTADTIELWLIDRGRPVGWQQLPPTAAALKQALRQLAMLESAPLPLVVHHIPDDVDADLQRTSDIDWPEASDPKCENLMEAAMFEAASIIAGQRTAPLEFRRDTLATENPLRAITRNLSAVAVAIAFFLASIGFVLQMQTQTFDRQRRISGDQQMEVFRTVFPERRVPVGVMTYLESEVARLRGLRGQGEGLPSVVAATELLQKLLQALPRDMRFRLLEIRIDNGELYLVGQVRSHGDADRIAELLQAGGLRVNAPSTHRLPTPGVEFRVSAELPDSSEVQPI